MFGITARRRFTADELLASWIPQISQRSTHWDSFTAEACEDLVCSMMGGRPADIDQALTRFGRQLGHHGWLLREVTEWVELLSKTIGARQQPLSMFTAGVAVAKGWAEGSQHGDQTDSCIDPLTGLANLPVLHLRLSQVFDQCAALGSSAADMYCLIVIDTGIVDLHPFERDAVRAVVAELVSNTFRGGETVAHHDGRIMVLTSSHDQIRHQLLDLIVQFDTSLLLDTCEPMCWIESLPASRLQLDRYLFELTPTL
jgi:GGDEF domain-containing protein